MNFRHPRAPLIQVIETFRGQRQRNYYPIELLVVCEDQRVKGNQSTQQITQVMLELGMTWSKKKSCLMKMCKNCIIQEILINGILGSILIIL